MRNISQSWQNISITKRLYIILGTMALLITLELLVLWVSMHALIAVRALVSGESIWSKSQKNSVIALLHYRQTSDPVFYDSFKNQIKVIKGDQKARLALLKKTPDYEQATQGLLEGQTHPDDIQVQMDLIVRFQKDPHVSKALRIWAEGDVLIAKLEALAAQLEQQITSKKSTAEIEDTISNIYMINDQLSVLENKFSDALGEGARWVEKVLLLTLLLAVFLVESTGITLTVFLARHLTKTIRELNKAADRIGQGDYSIAVPVESNDELGKLAWSLNKMSQDLEHSIERRIHAEQSSQTKSQFLANMSHEIRTPLNAILGFTELLKDDNLSSEERQKYLNIIERTGENLSTLINDILDLSKVEAGHMDLIKKEFSLPLLISEIKDLIENLASKKHLRVIFESSENLPQTIYSDPLRLRQVLMNLLNNAVKFTEYGFIKLSCQKEDDKLMFTIQDSGIGIKPQERELLFKPFSQIDSSLSRKHEGTGLGLVLSKRLTELLGGSISLEKSTQQGSTFVVTVPFKEPPHNPTARPLLPLTGDDSSREKLKGLSILIVDDVKDNLLLIEHYLRNLDLKIDTALNGLEALHKIEKFHYDFVLMDIQMPVMDGHTATKKLRTKGLTIPIVALTAHAMKEDKERSLASGCNDYLTKPINRNILINTIAKYVNENNQTSL